MLELQSAHNAPMHPTMQRMYIAAKDLLGIEGQSQLAVAIGESSQVVNNWESRGVSQRGAMKAARSIGCNPDWIMTGAGEMRGTSIRSASSGLSPQAIELATLFDLIPQDLIKRTTAFNSASQAILDVLQRH